MSRVGSAISDTAGLVRKPCAKVGDDVETTGTPRRMIP